MRMNYKYFILYTEVKSVVALSGLIYQQEYMESVEQHAAL